MPISVVRHSLQIVAVLLLLTSGCALLVDRQDSSGPTGDRQTAARAERPVTRDTIELEIAVVERPANDPVLGKLLWDEIDEGGVFDPAIRRNVNDNGFRVGIAGSAIPHSLQSLIELNDREHLQAAGRPSHQLARQPAVRMFAGGETLVPLHAPYAQCTIRPAAASEGDVTEYQQAVCQFRIRAKRLQDGWVRLEFLPEVRHGIPTSRYTAQNNGWGVQSGQQIDPQYDHRFELTLNLGEVAVISSNNGDPELLGSHFFVGNGENNRLRRAVVIRLANLSQVAGVRAGTGTLKR